MAAIFRRVKTDLIARGNLLRDAELGTGLPVRLAYISIMLLADARGVLPCDFDWLEDHAAPLDDWPWVDLIEVLNAMAYIDVWDTAAPCDGYSSFISIISWERLQIRHKNEKPWWPVPPVLHRQLHPTPCPANLMRRVSPVIAPTAPPLVCEADSEPETSPLDPLVGIPNAPADITAGIAELAQAGIPADIIVGVAEEHVRRAPAPIASWAEPWLMILYRMAMLRRADGTRA